MPKYLYRHYSLHYLCVDVLIQQFFTNTSIIFSIPTCKFFKREFFKNIKFWSYDDTEFNEKFLKKLGGCGSCLLSAHVSCIFVYVPNISIWPLLSLKILFRIILKYMLTIIHTATFFFLTYLLHFTVIYLAEVLRDQKCRCHLRHTWWHSYKGC